MARQEKRDEALTRTAPNRRCNTEGLRPSVRFERQSDHRQSDYRKSKGRPMLELKHLEKMERELFEQQLEKEKR